jgi:hypothetical protein
MSSHREQRPRTAVRALAAGVAAVLALVVLTSSALAVQDDLKGGSVTLQLTSSRGLKLQPSSLTLPITGGALDPVDGSGTVNVSGGFGARLGKGKAKVKIVSLTFGANGGPGSIAAKVGKSKKTVSGFGALTGGSVARNGWGAKISGVTATIAGKGAQALGRTFSGKSGKGARKSAGPGVKPGQRLGTVSAVTDPLAVAVVPGSGNLVLTVDTGLSGTFFSKLMSHCIDPLPTGSPAGVAPIAPATADVTGTMYTFPVSGGAAAPDFTAGTLVTAGGQTITKNSSALNPSGCSAGPPVGTQLQSTDFQVEFDRNTLASFAALPDGSSILAGLAAIDWTSGSRSVDPNSKQLTVTNANVTLLGLAADTINRYFPNATNTQSNDFAAGDVIGHIDLTATLR